MNPKHWRPQLRAQFENGRISPAIHNQVVRELKDYQHHLRRLAGMYRIPEKVLLPTLRLASPTYRRLSNRKAFALLSQQLRHAAVKSLLFGDETADVTVSLERLAPLAPNPLLELTKRPAGDI